MSINGKSRQAKAWRRFWPVAVAMAAMSLVAVPAAHAETKSFKAPGESPFTVPAGVTSLRVDLIGGAGGSTEDGRGGFGRRVQADLKVVPGEVLYVDVGEAGKDGRQGFGAGGGGASSVRLCSATAKSCPGGTSPLQSVLAIAGGGGGAGGSGTAGNGAGGDADNPGDDGQNLRGSGGGAGTTSGGGKGGKGGEKAAGDGAVGVGGRGGAEHESNPGGAGGKGGGGDGGAGIEEAPGGGGGGGGYHGGGGGGAGGEEDEEGSTAGAGGGGGGASWVISTATNISKTWTTDPASVTLEYKPAPTPPPRPPAPIVKSIAPSSGPLTGATTVILGGSNFANARRVLFGKTAAPQFALSGTTRMTVVVPAAAKAATVEVRVEGPGGLSAPNPAVKYTYTARATPQPGPAAKPCKVPELIGATLPVARRRLAAAHCTVGAVHKPKAKKGRRGGPLRVFRQSLAAGTVAVPGRDVKLWLRPSKRRH
jgi:hypothetical protein